MRFARGLLLVAGAFVGVFPTAAACQYVAGHEPDTGRFYLWKAGEGDVFTFDGPPGIDAACQLPVSFEFDGARILRRAAGGAEGDYEIVDLSGRPSETVQLRAPVAAVSLDGRHVLYQQRRAASTANETVSNLFDADLDARSEREIAIRSSDPWMIYRLRDGRVSWTEWDAKTGRARLNTYDVASAAWLLRDAPAAQLGVPAHVDSVVDANRLWLLLRGGGEAWAYRFSDRTALNVTAWLEQPDRIGLDGHWVYWKDASTSQEIVRTSLITGAREALGRPPHPYAASFVVRLGIVVLGENLWTAPTSSPTSPQPSPETRPGAARDPTGPSLAGLDAWIAAAAVLAVAAAARRVR